MGKTYWESTYKDQYFEFIRQVINVDPDYIIPVKQKSIKLVDAIQDNSELINYFTNKIRYLDYFDFSKNDLSNSRVLILDDVVRTGSTLRSYRNYFETYLPHPPKEIFTYGFVGHSQMTINPDKNFDKNTKIYTYLSEAAYKEYIAQQVEYLINRGSQSDIESMAIEFEVADFENDTIKKLREFLSDYGYLYQLESVNSTERFSLQSPSFFPFEEIYKKFSIEVKKDFVEKIRFCYIKDLNKFYAMPMCYPALRATKNSNCDFGSFSGSSLPFSIPCHYRDNHVFDKICYHSTYLLLNTLFARSLFLVLRDGFPESEIVSKKLKLKRRDLVRYVGQQVGNELADRIESYIKDDYSPLDEIIVNKKPKQLSQNHNDIPISLSRENVPLIFKGLRDGYENRVTSNNGNPLDISFVKSASELMAEGSGTNPLVFTEVLDEYCDYGSLVPVTTYTDNEGFWRRVYRTGEGPEDHLSWERSKFIVGFAIDELDTGTGAKRMLFEKSITNFIYDFPYSELHSLDEHESLWGPQTFVYNKLSNEEIPLDPRPLKYKKLYDWRNFAEYFDFNVQNGVYVRTNPYKNIENYFGSDSRFTEKYIRKYFQTLTYIRQNKGNSEYIYSLAICRNKNTFLRYLLKSVNLWQSNFDTLLNNIKQGNINTGDFKNCGDAAKSTSDKLHYANSFLEDINDIDELLKPNQDLFTNIWLPLIKKNTTLESQPLIRYHDEIQILSNVSKAINLLFQLVRLKVSTNLTITNREEIISKINKNGASILEVVGIPTRILHWPRNDQNPDFEEIYFEMTEASTRINQIVNSIGIINTQSVEKFLQIQDKHGKILEYSSYESPEETRFVYESVIKWAQNYGLLSPTIEEISILIPGKYDGNKFYKVSDRFGNLYGFEVIWHQGKLILQKFGKIKN